MRRRWVVRLLVMLAVMALAGCSGGKGPGGVPETGGQRGAGGKSLRVGLVLDTGGVDDRSFNAAAWAGLQRGEKELGAEGKYVESHDASDYKTNLTSFSQNYDLVFAVGFAMEHALEEV